jgi:CheY-like chemotaxis protein/anti-sigma regulatory factor (Ser/Thr protein kinase)
MSRVLVAEDTRVHAVMATRLLEEHGFEVHVEDDGRAALDRLRRGGIDLVLTDLQMPEMNGLELVEAVGRECPGVPVILMTQHGSEEIAVEALQKGAASYVPKRHFQRDIVSTVDEVLAVASTRRYSAALLRNMVRADYEFVLDNDPDLTLSLINQLQQNLMRWQACDELALLRVGVALREALINAIHHGNLEVSSELRQDDDAAYYGLVEERRRQSPYKDRRVHVLSREAAGEVTYVVRDEGRGFDPAAVPDPTDPANADRPSGRGLLLIRTFMDVVSHNPAGNEITMTKRFPSGTG